MVFFTTKITSFIQMKEIQEVVVLLRNAISWDFIFVEGDASDKKVYFIIFLAASHFLSCIRRCGGCIWSSLVVWRLGSGIWLCIFSSWCLSSCSSCNFDRIYLCKVGGRKWNLNIWKFILGGALDILNQHLDSSNLKIVFLFCCLDKRLGHLNRWSCHWLTWGSFPKNVLL